jgi:substrate import-associated zinc metallohydrolase lipoprotein
MKDKEMKIVPNSKLFMLLAMVLVVAVFNGCYEKEKIDSEIIIHEPSSEPLDIFIQENFVQKYGIAIRYRYVDRYVTPDKKVAPPRLEVVRPMLDFLTEFWIEPYLSVPNGEEFFKRHVPAEVVFIGSSMYNYDGTITLGTADAGARITLTEVNDINIENRDWLFRQLGTIYHEFAHIVHQNFKLPANFQRISPTGYTSAGSWYNLTDEEALRRGFVSPYGTSNANEDYAEIVAFLLYDPEFYENYIYDEEGCTTIPCIQRNEGRALIRRKLTAILAHHEQNTGVDLLKVRALIQEKLKN